MNDKNPDKHIEILKGRSKGEKLPYFVTKEAADEAMEFHKTIPEYEETSLVSHDALAQKLGIAGIYTKDESTRFNLKAFKALGASFAISKILEDPQTFLNSDIGAADATDVKAFVTATDGNHGKGMAWASHRSGKRSFVFMPKGSSQSRVDAIAAIGDTKVSVTDFNYADTVVYAAEFARKNGYILVQDTGFSGYEDIPNFITQGYTTMVKESISQLGKVGVSRPSHVFIQAGVGSVTGAVAGYMASVFGENRPKLVVMEPTDVACIYESAKNGEITVINGLVETDMAGLNCGAPNIFTWPILRDYADFYAKCPDRVTWQGMRRYAFPVGNDEKVISGESGAIGMGLSESLLSDSELAKYKEDMGFNKDSVILLFNTEGATDPVNYEKIISMK